MTGNLMFTLGLAQCSHPADANPVRLVESYAESALNRSVDLLVFPESLMTPYEKDLGQFLKEAEPLNGPFSESICGIAKRYGIWIVYTMNELNPAGGNPFNTAVIANPDGEISGYYRKVHLFDTDFTKESDRMSAGESLFSPITLPFCTLGLGICYDLRFPEVARSATLQGANMLLYPAAWVEGNEKIEQWQTLLRARAIENEIFVAGVSRCDKGYIGNSRIYGPRGELLAGADGIEQLIVVQIDLDLISQAKAAMPLLNHRRPGLYLQ